MSSFVFDSNTNEGCWTIKGDLLEQFKAAKNEQKFVSGTFRYNECVWFLKCYPNGYTESSKGHISLYLTCKKLADGVQKFASHDQFKVLEDNATRNKIGSSFEEGKSMGYDKLTKLNPDWPSLTITFKILEVLSQEGGDGWAHWNIHGFLFDELVRNVNAGETFWSPPFLGVDCEWRLLCKPIGHSRSSPDQIKVSLSCIKPNAKWSGTWIKYRLDVANGSAMHENMLKVEAKSTHDQLLKFDPNWKSLSIKARIAPLPAHQKCIEFTSVQLLSGATKVFTMHGEEWLLKLSQNQMMLYTKRKNKIQRHSTQNIYTKIECKDIGVDVERVIDCKYDEDWRKQLKLNSKVSYCGIINWSTYEIAGFLSNDRVKLLYRGVTGDWYEILSIYDPRIQPHDEEEMESKENEDHVSPSEYKRIGDAVPYDVTKLNENRSIGVCCTIVMMSEEHQCLYGRALLSQTDELSHQMSDKNRRVEVVSDVVNEQNKKMLEMEQEIKRLSAELDSLQAATVDYRLIVSQTDEKQQRISIAVKSQPVLNNENLYEKHESIVKEWNQTTQKLQRCASTGITQIAGDNEEEKECHFPSKLLEQQLVEVS